VAVKPYQFEGGAQVAPGGIAIGGAMPPPAKGAGEADRQNAADMGARRAPVSAPPQAAPQTWVGQSSGLPQYWEGMTSEQIMRATGQGQPAPQGPQPSAPMPPPVNGGGSMVGVDTPRGGFGPTGIGMGMSMQPPTSSKAMEPMGPAPKPTDRFSGMGIGMSIQPQGKGGRDYGMGMLDNFAGAQKPGNMQWGRAMGMGMQPGMGRSQRFSSMMPPAQNSGAAYDIFSGQLGTQKKF
jgi:hypothetical protein